MLIRWSPSFEVGNLLLDTQHRILFLLCMRMELAIDSGQESQLKRAIAELKKFAEFHFASEEGLMEEVGFPELRQHQKMHAGLLTQFESKLSGVAHVKENPKDVLVFLAKWLMNHVGTEDQKLSAHIAKSKQRPLGEDLYREYFGARELRSK